MTSQYHLPYSVLMTSYYHLLFSVSSRWLMTSYIITDCSLCRDHSLVQQVVNDVISLLTVICAYEVILLLTVLCAGIIPSSSRWCRWLSSSDLLMYGQVLSAGIPTSGSKPCGANLKYTFYCNNSTLHCYYILPLRLHFSSLYSFVTYSACVLSDTCFYMLLTWSRAL